MATTPRDIEHLLSDDGFVRRLARSLIRDANQADDVAQSAWLAALEHAPGADRRSWFAVVVRNLAHSQARAQAARERRESAAARAERMPSVADIAEREATRRRVVDHVMRLDEPYRTAVVLRFFEGWSPRRIAAQLGVPVETVRSRLKRALERLRNVLDEEARGNRALWCAELAPFAATKASLITGAILMSTTVKVLVAVAAFAALGWFLVPRGDSPGIVSSAATDERASTNAAAASPSLVALPPAANREVARAQALAGVRGSVRVVLGAEIEIVGRLLRPDGSPADGARLVLTGSEANEDRTREFGLPASWKAPDPLVADADGRFRLALVPPRAMRFALAASFADCAEIRWQWEELAESRIDVGEARFEPACTLLVRVVDVSGTPREGEYTIWATPAVQPKDPHRGQLFLRGARDPRSRDCVVTGVPAGRVQVQAQSERSDKLTPRVVEAPARGSMRVDLVDAAPADDTRIVVVADRGDAHWIVIDPAAVRLLREGSEPRGARAMGTLMGIFAFEGVPPGPCTIQIADPRFELWSQGGLVAGAFVRTKLRGSTRLRVKLTQELTREQVRPTILRLEYLDIPSSRTSVDLLKFASEVGRDGAYPVVPGTCDLVVEADGFPEQRVALGALAPNEVRDVEVELKPAVELRGRLLVSDGVTAGGNIEVQLTRGARAGHGMGRSGRIWTNGKTIPGFDLVTHSTPDGGYSFAALAPGTWTVRAVWSPWLVTDRKIEVAAGVSQSEDLVEPPSAVLEGRVLLPEGSTGWKIEVTVGAAESGIEVPVMSDQRAAAAQTMGADGRFRVGPLPVGRVTAGLMIGMPGALTKWGWPRENVEIEAGRTAHVEFDLRTAMRGSVQLSVFLGSVPATGGAAVCDSTKADAETPSVRGTIAGDGTALLYSLAPGAYRLSIDADDASWTWSQHAPVEVAPGAQLRLTPRIDLAEHNVQFVDGRAGAPLAGCAIEAVTGSSPHELASTRTTDALGTATYRLPIGPVTFRDPRTKAALAVEWGRDAASPLVVALKSAD